MGMAMREVSDAHSVEGIDDAQQKVAKFVKAVTESVEAEGRIEFELTYHGGGQEDEDPVFSVGYEPGDSASSVVEQVVEAAVEDADGYPNGAIKYVLRAEGVKSRIVFTLKVRSQEDEDIDDIEDLPNKKGLLSQLMRHQEKIMKVAVGSFKQVNDMTYKLLREKDERINTLEKGQMDTIRLVEDLMSGRHARDLELRRLEKKEQREDQVAGILMNTAPVLAAKFLGGSPPQAPAMSGQPASPQMPTPTPLENMLEGLMSSFSSEQFLALANSGLLRPEQIMNLVEIAKHFQAKSEAQNPTPPGEKGGA